MLIITINSENSMTNQNMNKGRVIMYKNLKVIDNHKFNRVPFIIWDRHKDVGIYVYGFYYLVSDCWLGTWEDSLLSIIETNKNNLENIPNCFANGMYAGIIIDKSNEEYYVFNNMFNHLPLFYSKDKNSIIISTEFSEVIETRNNSSFNIDFQAIREYLKYGLNFTDRSFERDIKVLPKCSIMKFDNLAKLISSSVYYKYPSRLMHKNYDDMIDNLSSLWNRIIQKTTIDRHLKFSLGLTGGVDSRFIFGESYKLNNIYYNTGNSQFNPDYIIASKITKAVGLEHKHILENYQESKLNKFNEFIDYYKDFDYHPFFSMPASNRQLKWRQEQGIDVQLTGNGGEYLGGEHYYTRRDSFTGIIGLVLGRINSFKKYSIYEMLDFITRAKDVDEDIFISKLSEDEYFKSSVEDLRAIINENDEQGYFLEKGRLMFKFSNLLQYSTLGMKEHYEVMSPFFDKELVDFTSTVDLKHRINRKLIYGTIRKEYPEISDIVIGGSVFTFNGPYKLFSFTTPIIKGLNHKGFRIPYYQSYLHFDKIYKDKNDKLIVDFKKAIVKELNEKVEIFKLNEVHFNNRVLINRLFNILSTTYKYTYGKYSFEEIIRTIKNDI